MSLQVQIGTFEGPLSLLLHLIKKDELDIYDIPINSITQQYLEYIQIMKELNLEVAGEFIAMAATLIYIKSRMLVPQYDANGEEIVDDPRKELVQQLVEYQRYQEAGKQLYKRPLVGRDLWLRGQKEALPKAEDEILIDEKGLFALIGAFRQLMKETVRSPHQVHGKGQSISAKLLQIKDLFVPGNRIEIRDLLPETFSKIDVIVTFLSVLELSRLGFIRIYQSGQNISGENQGEVSANESTGETAPLYIETLKPVTTDIVSRVQEFDSAQSEATANTIMAQAEEELSQVSLAAEASSLINQEDLENDSEVKAVEAGEII